MSSPLRRFVKAIAIGVVGSVAVGLARSVRPQAKPAPAGEASWEPLTTPPSPPSRSGPVQFVEPDSSGSDAATWVEPDSSGACPVSHPIKLNAQSGIFHGPGGQSYERTKAERCYVDHAAAEADGFRAAKR